MSENIGHTALITRITLFLLFTIAAFGQIQTNVPALKDVYAKDFSIGALLSYRHIGFSTDPNIPGQSSVIDANGGYLVKYHMNIMSPGNNMKPQYTVDLTSSAAAYNAATADAKDSMDTHPVISFNADLQAQLNWAKRQGFHFRGHTLVWHNQTPTEFFYSGYTTGATRLTKDKMTSRLENYIKEIIRLIHANWPGMLQAIDVVNEAIDDNTNKVRTSGNDWYTTFGDSTYIMSAFQFARKYTTLYGETQIKLYYNDYSTSTAKKADGIVRLVTPIFEAGYLDGIGMQEHDANQSPTAADWIATYNKFYPICNEMSVTEFDVATGSASPSASVLGTQANQYGQLFKCFVERSYLSGRGKIRVVTKDGLNDTYTFQTNQSSSLWNGQDQCKPAFYAVANVGKNFNELDSLLKYADTLKSVEYTSGSWTHLAAIRTLAKNAQTANYSASSSAADTLGAARDSLLAAIQGLVKAPSDVRRNANDAPKTYALGQNYPNPFNPTTRISYSVPQSGYISLKVYNVLGKEVAVLFEGMRKAGSYVATFNGTGLASGVYFYRLQTNNYTDVKKLVLMK